MNNEAILNKLVELGYTKRTNAGPNCYKSADDVYCHLSDFNPENRSSDFMLIQDALIAECAKKHLEIVIEYEDVHIISPETRETIFGDKYSRQAIIEAFCKVTGVECDT